ncbi:MAG: ABC transporter permease [Gammaproteobacteria bacterium]|nr:ABC transporter permease [Gammaproteobacteria bacterium]
MFSDIINATWQTVYMVIVSGLIATLIGLPIGVLLEVSKKKHILANRSLYHTLNIIVNIGRSIPFIILLIAIIPFTRLLVGTSIGTTAAIVPLTIGAAPFVARLTENALMEVPSGLIEAALAMGATPWQIIVRFLLPEAWPTIINGITLTLVTLVSYSAMAGAVGGGGLGDFAIRYGYQRFQTVPMIVAVVILVIVVQWLQWSGDCLAKKLNKGEKLL